MQPQDFQASLQVRSVHDDPTVEAASPQQRRVENCRAIRLRQNNYTLSYGKTRRRGTLRHVYAHLSAASLSLSSRGGVEFGQGFNGDPVGVFMLHLYEGFKEQPKYFRIA